MMMPALSTTSDEKKVSSALEKKRLYNKHRNRALRRLEAEEKTHLTRQIEQLEATMAHLHDKQPASALTWREIAAVFVAELRESQAQASSLRVRVQRYVATREALEAWCQHMPTGATNLLAHDEARQIAFDWIGQRLLHNVPAVLLSVDARPLRSDGRRTVVEPSGNSYQMTTWSDRVERTALHAVAKGLYAVHFQADGAAILDTPGTNMVYLQSPSTFGALRSQPFEENVLVCQWAIDDARYVVCAQSILSDALHRPRPLAQNWTSWTIADRVDAQVTRVVRCLTMGGLRTGDGAPVPFSLEEPEIANVHPSQQWTSLVQARMAYAQHLEAHLEALLQRALARSG
ncbi:hypothetical protein SPRG_14301 [Saprolegnia parasitica CBS 223.65]|uniref:Uncharacterized protein n=1 Tax=Saprolegnia parasitica (strain CBS 223.65) TaxID=695850 RepID=A0A067BMC6_SAPPC|nr:hypothetical protein SPRG_14301 [Saprolegnia parasitica CBS 223.65]KDO19624.1 hypothetical protein SPRG_14301 [Saprolegnia parasitica CBS 223.65]|eukprot:XP_012209673.1 hypothetical protein SPRG_14301 [Saprolegnia parasitica CBS 223.65]